MTADTKTQIKFTFSGHESFQCRHLWLKKGYDFVNKKKSFNNDDAVVDGYFAQTAPSRSHYTAPSF